MIGESSNGEELRFLIRCPQCEHSYIWVVLKVQTLAVCSWCGYSDFLSNFVKLEVEEDGHNHK